MGRYPCNPPLEEVVRDAFLNKVGSRLIVGHAQFPFSHRCFDISRPLEVPDGWTNVLCAWQPYPPPQFRLPLHLVSHGSGVDLVV
jgi:hypothetical protein